MKTSRNPSTSDDLAGRLFQITRALSLEERNILNNPAGLARAADFIEEFFTRCGLVVSRQSFAVGVVDCHNIEAVTQDFIGTSEPHWILGAHYDSAPGTPGADDNSSAVAILLETARLLCQSGPAPRNIRFVAYTNEEPPHFLSDSMGSRVHARSCRKNGDNLQGMVCLESLGYFTNEPDSQKLPVPDATLPAMMAHFRSLGIEPTVGNYLALVADDESKPLLARFATAFSPGLAIPSAPVVMPEIRLSDHLCYWDEGFPAIMVTDTALFRNPNYHRYTDTVETLDFEAMASITRQLVATCRDLSGHPV